MKNRILFSVILSFFLFNNSFSQPTDSLYYSHLYYTCKAWGYVKYFHSNIAKGNVDWDAELLQTLQNLKTAETNDEFNNLVVSLIDGAGQMVSPTTTLPSYPDSLLYNLDLNWTDAEIFSEEVKTKIDTISNYFVPRHHYLVSGSTTFIDNPKFQNDNLYFDDTVFNNDIGLLGLFRYWNIINYYFPYKYIMDQSWDQSLKDVIPAFANAKTKQDYAFAFLKLRRKTNDSHAKLWNPVFSETFSNHYPRINIKYIENEFVIFQTFGDNLGVDLGDIILEINGTPIKEIADTLKPYMYGSNESILNYICGLYMIRGKPNTFIDLRIQNKNEQKDVRLVRDMDSYERRDSTSYGGEKWREINSGDKNFGYMSVGAILPEDVDSLFSKLENVDFWIIDSRSYPRGTHQYFENYLFSSTFHNANFLVPDVRYPGHMSWQEMFSTASLPINFEKPYALLFDERTQSSSEFLVMTLEANERAVKIGSQTSGADGNASYIYLPFETEAVITMLGVFYPDYSPTQRIGIIPDIEVKPTIQGIREGRDEVIEAAINYFTTSIPENNKYANTRIYPNPVNESIHILSAENTVAEIIIFDITGKVLITQKFNSNSINVSSLESGTYFISFISKNFTETYKFIKLIE
jgi:carboxyl-terminal processing protease